MSEVARVYHCGHCWNHITGWPRLTAVEPEVLEPEIVRPEDVIRERRVA